MTEFGGPEVLQARRAARLPSPAAGRGADPGQPRGAELRRHPHAHELLRPEGRRCRWSPAARWRACARTPASASWRSSAAAAMPSTRSRPQERVFPIPDGLDDGSALAMIMQGTTAWHLYRTAGRVAAGESVVVHGAAGGVGSLARPARPPVRGGPRDRDGLQRGRSARWRSSSAPTWPSTRRRRGSPSG